MTLLASAQLLPRGLPAGATSALRCLTRTIPTRRAPTTRHRLTFSCHVQRRRSEWTCFAQVALEHLGEYFTHSHEPAA
jgi:hypothetical protein